MTMRTNFFLFLTTLSILCTFGCTMTFDDSWMYDDDSACDDDAVADDDVMDDDDAVADDDDTTPPPDSDNDGDPDTTDCNDADAAIYNGADEVCDEVDSDCDGSLVDGFANMDGDSEPDCVDNDVDGDGFSEEPDCDDSDPASNPDALEVCDDGLDNDCDGDVDAQDDECEDGVHEVTITVTYGYATPAIDFSYGYCSNLQDPADCNAWNQSVVTATPNASQVSFTIQGVTGGVIRANSSRFYQQSDYNVSTGTWSNADSWLCQLGPSGPELTGAVYIYVDGIGIGHFGYCIPFGNGSSLGLDIGAIIGSALEN